MRLGTTNQDVLICICSLTTLVILILSCSVLQCWLYICPAASIKWEAQISVDGWGSIARSIPRFHKIEPTIKILPNFWLICRAVRVADFKESVSRISIPTRRDRSCPSQYNLSTAQIWNLALVLKSIYNLICEVHWKMYKYESQPLSHVPNMNIFKEPFFSGLQTNPLFQNWNIGYRLAIGEYVWLHRTLFNPLLELLILTMKPLIHVVDVDY